MIKSWLLRSRGSEPGVGIEVLSGLPHDMEHHCELARQRYGGALEAETLLERQSQERSALAERTRVRITVAAS